MTTAWQDVAKIHRLEYPFPLSYAGYALLGACYAVSGVAGLLSVPVLLTAVAGYLCCTAGVAINTVADIRTDERHADRGHLPRAVARFGRTRVLRWITAECGAALGLSIVASAWTGRWVITAVAVAIVLSHLAYNVEPLRLKRRGLLGPPVFAAAVVVLPSVLSYLAVRGEIEPYVGLLLAGVGILAVGRVTWWTVPDVGADAAAGLATPGVRHGAMRTVAIAGAVMLAGLGVLGWALWQGHGPLAAALGTAAYWLFLAVALVLVVQPLRRGLAPDSRRLRKRTLPLVLVGELVLITIGLAA